MTSRTTVLAVVIGLGVYALAALGCTTFLIQQGIDAAAVGLVGTPMGMALGGLTGILASTRSTIGAKETEPTTMIASVTPTISWSAPPMPAAA